MSDVRKASEHVRKYLIYYTLAVIALAVVTGPRIRVITSMSNQSYSLLVEILAIATIFPSMVTLRADRIVEAFRMWREVALGLVYVYGLTPILSGLFASLMSDRMIGLGYFISNIVTASSAALGYVLIASGNMELATVLVLVMTLLTFAAVPGYLALYSSITTIEIPIAEIVYSLVVILLAPLAAGQLLRYYLTKVRGPSYVDKELRPHLSLATMLSMLVLIFVLIARKSSIVITKPWIAGEILSFQTVLVVITIPLLIAINRALGMRYADHQAIVLTTITKNQSVAAAIATSSLGGGSAALPAALIPAIQPVLAIAYIHMENLVKRVFRS